MKTNKNVQFGWWTMIFLCATTYYGQAKSSNPAWPFTLNCPANAYVNCTDELWNLSAYGNATYSRGANSGIQDSDNLAWKLKLVDGKAPATLLDTYTEDRGFAADENIMNSTRSTDFITPKSRTSKTFRNAVLGLAEHYPFARALGNSGRLSVPSFLTESRLNTPDSDPFAGVMVPGAPMDDAPVESADGQPWPLNLLGNRFQLLYYIDDAATLDAATVAELARLDSGTLPVQRLVVAARGSAPGYLTTVIDSKGRIREPYDMQPGTVYLARPDQHVAARWRAFDAARIRAALARATCNA